MPAGRYLTCPVDVRVDTGGQTRALLMRNRILAAETGIEPGILTFGAATDLDERRAALLERGLTAPGVHVYNVYEHFRATGWVGDRPTGRAVPDLRSSLTSEQYFPDGSPWRLTYKDPATRKVTYDFLRADGTAYLRVPRFGFSDATTWPRKGSIVRISPDGQHLGAFGSLGQWFRRYIRELTAEDERAFVFMDSRHILPHIAPLDEPDIYLLYLMHNLHVTPPHRWDSPTNDVYTRALATIGMLDAFCTLTDRQRQDVAQRCGNTNNLFVVPNPVDLPPEPPHVERDPNLVTVVARLEKQKRLSHTVAAFEHVVAKMPQARMEIYGSGSETPAIQSAIDRRGLSESIRLMGHHPRAREALWHSSTFLLTSLFEGYPLATLESFSHGCPVVAYDIRYGPREQVTHGVDGFLVEPGDVEGMARYVVELLSSPELVNKMSVAAREKAASHGTERFLGDWKRIIEAAIAQKTMRTRIKKVKLTVQDLVVAAPPTRFRLGKRLQRGPSTPPGQHGPEDALVFRGTLLVLGGSPGSKLGSAEVRLAAVDDASGSVIDLPIDVDRKGRRFFLEAQVPLSNLPRASGADASNYRLRLRLNWRNSSWQTDLGRRSKQPEQAEVIFDPLGTARVIV